MNATLPAFECWARPTVATNEQIKGTPTSLSFRLHRPRRGRRTGSPRNTLQALKDILGSQIMPDASVALRGLGEQGAVDAGDKDHTQNPARRKSELVLNSRLVVTLFGKQ